MDCGRSILRVGGALALLAISVGLPCGCSIYPLPEDATGFRSRQIVRIVRCQVRDAVRKKVISILGEFGDSIVYDGLSGTQAAAFLSGKPDAFEDFEWRRMSRYAAPTFRFYADTLVSYDFTIDSSEMNNAGFDVSLFKPITGSTTTLGLALKNERTRQVKRQSRNYDSFEGLVTGLTKGECKDTPNAPNPVYPSTGLERLDTLIDDFVEQNQEDNLGSKTKPQDAEMNETIVFTTKFAGNVDPKITNALVPGSFVPTQINLSSANYRLDTHTIIVLLTLPADRSKLPRFDRGGVLLATTRKAIDDKLDQIRRNNFQDDVRNIGANSLRAN